MLASIEIAPAAVACVGLGGVSVGAWLAAHPLALLDIDPQTGPRSSRARDAAVAGGTSGRVAVLALLAQREPRAHRRLPVSPRYLAITLVTGTLFAAVAVRAPSYWAIPPYCLLAATLVLLSAIDIVEFRIPKRIVYATVVVGVPMLATASAATHRWASLGHAALAGGATFTGLLLLHLATPHGIGFGDVRLAGLCGMFLGWLGLHAAVAGMLLSFVAAGVTALALLASGRISRDGRIPFGPFLALGTLGAVLLGPLLLQG